jgi:hypothetical protein
MRSRSRTGAPTDKTLRTVLQNALKASLDGAGINPKLEGRIAQTNIGLPCN